MAQICYLNGEFLPLAEAKVPVLDRGFIFGDGVYEVVPAYGRTLFRLPEHLARLAYSLGQVRIANPYDAAGWTKILQTLGDRSDWDDQGVYYIRQVGDGIAWSGMSEHYLPPDRVGRDWNNVAIGTLHDDLSMTLDWWDVPRGNTLGGGTLTMQVGSDERRYPWMDEGFNTFADYDAAEAFFKGTAYGDTVRRELLGAYTATALPGSEQPLITKPPAKGPSFRPGGAQKPPKRQQSVAAQETEKRKRGVERIPLIGRGLSDIVSELRKGTWPTREETVRLGVAVIIVSVAIGLALGGIDLAFNWLVDNTLLK